MAALTDFPDLDFTQGNDAWQRRNERHQLREERLNLVMAEAAQVSFTRLFLYAITALITGTAWLAAKFFRVWLVAAAHVYASAKVGWNDGMGRGPTKAQLLEQNHAMRVALERVGGDIPAMNYAMRGAPQ